MDGPMSWGAWRPGRRPGWAGSQLGRRWELVRHSPEKWTLRFVDAGVSVTLSDSGSVDEIAAAIRRAPMTGQARRRLLQALERSDELGHDPLIAVSVN